MTRLIAGLACVVCACLPASALAAAHTGDVAATRAYLRAGNAYEVSADAEVGAMVTASEARAGQIAIGAQSMLIVDPIDRMARRRYSY